MGRKLIHKSIAFLLVCTLAYVQTVLVVHQSHRTAQHSHKTSNNDQVSTYTVKCVVCDFISTRRSEPALISSPVHITVFEKSIQVFKDRNKTGIIYCFQEEHSNRGPPIV